MYDIPAYALEALDKLNNAGFKAYLVGGCVRDFVMGITPHDFDVNTNALPEQIKEVFDGYNIILTGARYGTVTVIIDENPVEITTFRTDGNYSDNRRPDNVSFTKNLVEDLKRRDFTINAMVMERDGFVRHHFGGSEDIENKIIRCVGNAEKRFDDDALRILRALRFASKLGFSIESKTAEAIHKKKNLLKNISAERINAEFIGILCGKNAENVLREYRGVIAVFIPEITPCFDFRQNTPYHKYDVWEHTIHAVGNCADNQKVKTAMFFHDIAKPRCCTTDETGRRHFKGHAYAGAKKTEAIMKRLKFSNRFITDVTSLVRHHSDELNSKYEIKKLIRQIGIENTLDLLDVQRADSMSKNDFCRERLKKSDAQEKIVREIIENNECVYPQDLAIGGDDLIRSGFRGKAIGTALENILDAVISDRLPNEHDALVSYARSIISD